MNLLNLNPLTLKIKLAIAAGILLLVATGSFFLGKHFEANRWEAKLATVNSTFAEERRASAEALALEAEKAMELQQELIRIAQEADTDYEERRNEIDRLEASNRELVAKFGGLRDPGKRERTCPPAQGGAGSSERAEDPATEARLSAEASEFLLSESRRADEAAAWATTCWNWLNGQGLVKPS